ncbi:MAG TPA: hypothetical protein VKB95_10705 [Chitinophagaceae bacterium]|nr:hypothetical protein [Chitinophagaceae bacterium]
MIDRFIDFIEKYGKAILVIFIVAIMAILGINHRNNVNRDGRITIAKVIDFQGASSGVNVHIIIYYGQKEYRKTVDVECNDCVGNYFFVKILPEDPQGYVIFYDRKQVPECILTKPIPPNGWDRIPQCE